MKKQKRIAVLLSPESFFCRIQIGGILDYARTHGNWTIDTKVDTFSGTLEDLRYSEFDGAIGRVDTKKGVRLIHRLGIPFVALAGNLQPGLLPRVLDDRHGVGRMAAEHLLERGFRRLAYVGRGREADHTEGTRYGGFLERATTDGAVVANFMMADLSSTRKAWNETNQRLREFLSALKHPVGVMAANDMFARRVLDACHSAGLNVPNDVAIIGTQNNEPICISCDPPLSSIDMPDYEIGYEAAALLDRLLTGRKVPLRDTLLPPKGVVQRGSTDVLAIDNPHVRAAAKHIHDHVGEAFGVERLLQIVPFSRRWLESHFRDELGCTPHQYIWRVRVASAKRRLVEQPKEQLQDVAAECGFPSALRFRIVFQRLVGMKPGAYRRQQLQ